MPYDFATWRARHNQRIDISQRVTHLTRGSYETKSTAVETLLSILSDGVINGSDTAKAFIAGPRKAVCFQDAPLLGLAQNVEFERDVAPKMGREPSYEGCGLSFSKPYAFQKGARPVLYERTEDAKRILRDQQEFWRIVKLDLSDPNAFIDWTHEREWRCPDEFRFEHEKCVIILADSEQYRAFVTNADPNMLRRIGGISVLRHSIA